MNMDEIFESYADKMSQLCLYQRAMKGIAKKELEKLAEYEKSLEEHPEIKDSSLSFHNMAFRSAKTGKHIFYGHKRLSIDDRRVAVFLHKNKQYQWLLAEAYEAYEDCIERLYAFAGFADNDFWPLKDYGGITLSEISHKDFNWFERQAINKKDAPSSIINKFRESIPSMRKLEDENKLDINLRLAVTTVEFLRHIIVHNGGLSQDKSKFMDNVLKKCGLYNNGKMAEEHASFIDYFFGDGEYENTVVLLEIPTNPETPLDIHINVLDELFGYLMAHAHLICESLRALHNKSLNGNAAGGPH